MLKRETIAELREARDFCLFFDPSGARGAELARATAARCAQSRKRRPMRVIQCTTRVDMAAADFWALRMDQNFDAFCARCDDTDMELLSRREEQSNGQTLQVIECLLLYRENPVPATFQHMFGERLAGTHTLRPRAAVLV